MEFGGIMIEAIVKISGSIFCLGVGTFLLAFGVMILSVFVVEVLNHLRGK